MGLFDFFLSEEKQIQRHVRRLTNRDSQPEDREASARWLAEKATPQALIGLLARFDINLDHQLKDAGEKEFVFSLLAGLGEAAIEPTRTWLRQCKHFALPLRLLGEIGGPRASLDMAFELLEIEGKKDDFKPDKKKALLVWLVGVKDPRCVEKAAPFLADFDEGVRYAAIEVLVAQGGDAGRAPLEAVLVNPREESNRLRVRVAEVFAQRGWRAGPEVAERVPEGFAFRDGRITR